MKTIEPTNSAKKLNTMERGSSFSANAAFSSGDQTRDQVKVVPSRISPVTRESWTTDARKNATMGQPA